LLHTNEITTVAKTKKFRELNKAYIKASKVRPFSPTFPFALAFPACVVRHRLPSVHRERELGEEHKIPHPRQLCLRQIGPSSAPGIPEAWPVSTVILEALLERIDGGLRCPRVDMGFPEWIVPWPRWMRGSPTRRRATW